ncbi:MAG: hypothetical protein H7255_08035 [Ramlibacter sp.]|nr:hypothetical protein [Ramlibacter sp.]
MKKLNLHDVYSLAKEISDIREVKNEATISDQVFPLWFARARLQQMISSALLLSSSTRAAEGLINAINAVVPVDVDQAMNVPPEPTLGWQAGAIRGKVREFETVLGNDMPDIASYLVSQKGIYRTADLIAHAENQLSDDARAAISEQTCIDIRDAGRALAYELPTACAFHLWRAVESCMGTYYVRLTGKDWEAAKITRNWAAYIKAMTSANAPTKITGFLDHIRDQYRNPQTHPHETVALAEAQRLFPVALSAIEQLVLETAKLPTQPPAPIAMASLPLSLPAVASAAPP